MAPNAVENGKRHLMFSYGTLKRGQPNNDKMHDKQSGEAIFLCEAVTVDRWPLIVESKHGVPFLLGRKGEGQNVKGELYEIDDQMLASLDIIECHPHVYQRTEVKTRMINHPTNEEFAIGDEVTCYMYILYKYSDKILQFPAIEEYDDNTMDIKFDRNLSYKDLEATMAEFGMLLPK